LPRSKSRVRIPFPAPLITPGALPRSACLHYVGPIAHSVPACKRGVRFLVCTPPLRGARSPTSLRRAARGPVRDCTPLLGGTRAHSVPACTIGVPFESARVRCFAHFHFASLRAVGRVTRPADGPVPVFRPVQRAPSPSGKAEVCKTSTPGSNPGGASNHIKELPTPAGANVGDVNRTVTVHRRVFVRSENQSPAAAWGREEARRGRCRGSRSPAV
jgi:hypothetical protein